MDKSNSHILGAGAYGKVLKVKVDKEYIARKMFYKSKEYQYELEIFRDIGRHPNIINMLV